MKCLSPVSIKVPSHVGKPFIEHVPCGKCYHCLVNKRSQWSFRLWYEATQSQSNYFITLTYDDEHLVFKQNYAVLDKLYVQKWLKNLVQYCRDKYSVIVKYYLCGEYGWKSGRPHYHLHLFNLPPDVDIYNFMVSRWHQGSFYIGSTTGASSMYTTKHNLLKLLRSELNPNYIVESIESPFFFVSKSIGKDFYKEFIKKVGNDYIVNIPRYISADGKKIPLPRYYRDIFNKFVPSSFRDVAKSKYKRRELNNHLFVDRQSINYDRDIPYLRDAGYYVDLNEFNNDLFLSSITNPNNYITDVQKYTEDKILEVFKFNQKC